MSDAAMAQAEGQNPISMRQLLEAGVHFGHNTGRWNPKMKPYIFGARAGIHIINLQHTVKLFRQAFQAVIDTTARGEKVLFVGTKKQAQDVMRDEADRSGQMHVTQRWLGGTLTNFKTVKTALERLRNLEKMEEDGTILALTKKEQIRLRREKEKLLKSLGGIKEMNKLPGMMFVVDPNKEHIAIAEARKLDIPVVAVTDTNCNPDEISYVIPGNDDAIRAIRLFANRIADASIIGARLHKERAAGRGKVEEQPKEQVIHVTSGGDGPMVEIAQGGSNLTPEASASPDPAMGSRVKQTRFFPARDGHRPIAPAPSTFLRSRAMADVTASMIKDLRERTAAGMADCKKALVETEGDIDKAVEFLRKKGLAKAAKKAGRIATEGAVASYIHAGGRVGVLVEINCETDFVARNEDFQNFVKEVSLQIAAMNPQYVTADEVPADVVASERAIHREKNLASGKPEKIVDKITDGQVQKWLAEICLMDQPWVKDDKKSITALQQELVAKLGENIKVRRFTRYELGEGLEKREDDFAAEVAKQAGLA